MLRDSSGRTLSPGLEFLTHLSQIMVFNLTVKPFGDYGEIRIRNGYSTLAYPQGNGKAEAVNKVIVHGLKKRLYDTK